MLVVSFALDQWSNTARAAEFARAIECALREQDNDWQDKKVRFSEVKNFISAYTYVTACLVVPIVLGFLK